MEPWAVCAACLLVVAGSIPAAAQSTGLPSACIKMSQPEVVPVSTAGGVLTSPFFSDHMTYPTHLDCLWRLSTPDGFYPIVIVDQFDLEPRRGAPSYHCNDFLLVHFTDRGPAQSEYGDFCGSQIPKCFYYDGRHIDLRFVTDGNTQSNMGWRITYNASRAPVCPVEDTTVVGRTTSAETTPHVEVVPSEPPQILTTTPGLTIMPSESPPLVGAIVGGTLACVAIVILLLLWCFCCYWRRKKRQPQTLEALATPRPRPDIVVFRPGEDRTSLVNPNYGQRSEFARLAAMSGNLGATPDNCYSPNDMKQPLLEGAASPVVESPKRMGPPNFIPPSPPPPSGKDWSGGPTYPDDVFENRIRTEDEYSDPGYAEIDETIAKVGEESRLDEFGHGELEGATARGRDFSPNVDIFSPRPKLPAKRTPPYAEVNLLETTEKGGKFSFDVSGELLPVAEGYDEPMATASRDSGHGTAGSDADGYEVPVGTHQELEDADGYAVPIATALPNNQSKLGYDHLHGSSEMDGRKHGIGYDRLHGNKVGYDHLSRESDQPVCPRGRSSKYSHLDNKVQEQEDI